MAAVDPKALVSFGIMSEDDPESDAGKGIDEIFAKWNEGSLFDEQEVETDSDDSLDMGITADDEGGDDDDGNEFPPSLQSDTDSLDEELDESQALSHQTPLQGDDDDETTYEYADVEDGYYRVDYGEGTVFDISDEQIKQLIALDQWAQSIPPEVQNAMQAIRTGQAVVIPISEAQEFLKWRENPQPQTQETSEPKIPDFLEPEIAAYFKSLQDEIKSLKAQQNVGMTPPDRQTFTQPQYDPRYEQQVQQNMQMIQERRNQSDILMQNWQAQHNLSDPEMERLIEVTADLKIIPRLIQENTYRSPDGQVVSAPSMERVLDTALRMGAAQLPDVAAKLFSVSAPTPTPAPAPVRTQPNTDTVPLKKARSASLSAAPTSSPVASQRELKDLSPDELNALMAADIRAAMASAD